MGDCMSVRSNVVALPTRCDLDQLGSYAALTVMAVELARIAMQGDAEITLNGERRTLTREAMLAIAQDMLEQRQAIADASAGLVERVAQALATMGQAEALLDRSTELAAAARAERERAT